MVARDECTESQNYPGCNFTYMNSHGNILDQSVNKIAVLNNVSKKNKKIDVCKSLMVYYMWNLAWCTQ